MMSRTFLPEVEELNQCETKSFLDKNEVTFPAKKYLRGSKSGSGDGDGRRSTYQSGNIIRRSEWKLGKEEKNGTPRILRVIRRHSCKGDYKDKFKDRDKSPSVCLEEDKSKSSVVLLHHDKDQHQEQEQEQELSLFNSSCKPGKNYVRVSKSEQTTVTEPLPPHRLTTPRIFIKESTDPSPRPRLPRRRKTRRRSAVKYEPLNVNIIQQTPECRSCKSNPNDPASNQMALHHQPINQKPSRKLDDTKRVFPFRPTPSGNLKVIPNQVVFETNRVSVLVADPKHTKVNVKAELTKSDPSFHQDLQSQEFEAGNFLQQAKSSQASSEYIPRTQPYRIKHRCPEMDPNNRNGAQHQSRINHENLNQVPLASLGFTADQPIDWDNITLPEKSDLYCELSNRITSYKNADCAIKIGNDEFHCHLLVLQSYSRFFDEKNSKDIDLTESSVTSKAFSIIYDWMISESNESCQLLRRDNILEIFMAAQFLGIKELEEQCWAFIDNNDLFSEDTAFLLYVEARKLGNTPVMELMVPRIMKFFLLLVSTKDFLELQVEELCLLLRSNYICVNSEMEVLMSAVRWLMHDWETRRQYMLSVLKCVRFGLIAPWQLVEVKRNPENPEFMELMSNPEVQKMVDDGLAFVIIKHWYGNQTEDYYRWIDLLGLTEPTSRNWAGEDKNYVTYQEFLLYLEDYQRSMMLELKSRKGKSNSNTSTNTNQKSECSEAKTWVNYYQNQNLGVETTNGQEASAPNNGSRSWKFKKMPPPPISERIGSQAPEFLNKYLSRLDGNRTKVDAQPKDNEQEKKIRDIGNAAVNLDIRRNDQLKMSQVNYQNQQIQIQQCLTSLCEPNSLPPKKLSYPTNYCLASGDHQIRGKPGSIGQNERIKVAQLLSADQKNTFGQSSNDSDDKNVTCANTYRKLNPKIDLQGSKKVTRHEIDNKKMLDMMETLQSTSDGEKIAKSYCVSIANNAINQIDACKPIEMIKPPNFLYNSDDKTGSISVSYSSTDIDDSYSPNNHKNLTINNNSNNNITKETKVTMNKKLICPNESLFLNEQPTVIVFGGIDPHQEYGVAGNTGKNIYRLKPLENIWEFVGEMPEPRHHHSVVYFKGRLYVAGGADPRENSLQRKNSVVGTVWSYDPASRKWFTEPAMLTPRKNFGLVVCDGKIFAVGGEDNNGVTLRSVEAFDPAKKIWKKMQPMNIARVGLAATTFENLIWVAGGISNSITDPLLKEVECYDPCKKLWTKIESLPSARCYACLCVISDNLFLVGGAGKSSTDDNMTESIPTVDIWVPSSRNWQQISKMSTARHNHSISSIDNQLLVIGGVTTVHMKTLKSVECFCCRRNKWIKGVASLPYPILGHSSVSLPPSDYFSNS